MKSSLSQEMSTLFDMALKLLLLLRQKFEFNEFKAKIKSWYPENCPCKLTGYLSFVDAPIICESLFRDCTAELSQFGNTF